MKKFISILLILLSTAAMAAADSNASKKELGKLWEKYEASRKKDLPKTSIAILEEIKSTAAKEHFSADFHEAVNNIYYLKLSQNWKLRESLEAELGKEVEKFDEPAVTFLFRQNYYARIPSETQSSLKKFVKQNAGRLKERKNTYFYKSIWALDGIISETISNDYEYCLWELDDYDALIKYIGERYPATAYLEFEKAKVLKPESKCEAEMRVLEKKYAGTAMALYPKGKLLYSEFNKIKRNKANEHMFKALYSKVREFEKERREFKRGIDKKIAATYSVISELKKELEYKSTEISVKDGQIKILFTNDSSIEIKCLQKAGDKNKPLWTKTIRNETNSFYIPDTVSFKLPEMDDGEYCIVGKAQGLDEEQIFFDKKTISLALRKQKEGFEVYAADYKTGKPVKAYKVSLLKNGEIQKNADIISEGGFSLLPKAFFDAARDERNTYSIICSCEEENIKRISNEAYFSLAEYYDRHMGKAVSGRIYKDRGAYNPGDVVKFKAVLYKNSASNGISALEKGVECEAVLDDSEGNKLSSLNLNTNNFGAVAGEFELPKGKRNGKFSISISVDGKYIVSDLFTVDEFVLPTFSIAIDEDKSLYTKDDSIKIKGKVSSYSGHSLSGARVSISFDDRYSKSVDLQGGGFFEAVLTKEEREEYKLDDWLNIEVKVTDATGETLSAHTTRAIRTYLHPIIRILNQADAKIGQVHKSNHETEVIYGNILKFKVLIGRKEETSAPVDYEIFDEKGGSVTKGTTQYGKEVEIKLPGTGFYSIKASPEKSTKYESSAASCNIIAVSESDKVLDAPVGHIIYRIDADDNIKLHIGSTSGAIYAIASLFADKGELLDTGLIELKGKRGEEGSLEEISFDYRESYPDAVRVQVFFFKNGGSTTYNTVFRRKEKSFELPLTFSRFTDAAAPGSECSVEIKTCPEVEAVVSVFDKSVEKISKNNWQRIFKQTSEPDYVNIISATGKFGTDDYSTVMIRGTAKNSKAFPMSMALAESAPVGMELMEDTVFESEEAIPFSLGADFNLREIFSNTLAFLPFLNSDKDGLIKFDFKASDKLSTYIVKVFAHDRQMRNNCVEKELVVSIPVKLSLVEPRYLYENDSYVLQASVESNMASPIKGNIQLSLFDTSDHKNSKAFIEQSSRLDIPADGGAKAQFAIALPKGIKTLGIKTVFASTDNLYSDGVFVNIPVKKAEQSLTEAHSAVLKSGADRAKLVEELSGRFVNASADKAVLKEISLLDMIKGIIPEKISPESDNVLSLSEAYYSRAIASTLVADAAAPDAALLDKILACRNADGGFAWFAGMESSHIISAVVLERFAKLRERGFGIPELATTVRFLDNAQLAGYDSHKWYSRISLAQYLHVRSMYPEVAFEPVPVGEVKLFKKRLSAFRKSVKQYLTPKEERGMNGWIFAKARRTLTLEHLFASKEGVDLAKSMGVSGWFTSRKLKNSINADVRSLEEYAQEYRDGGLYYPNAVLPWRGLLESEAYAHSVLCDLMSRHNAGIADGIRLWLMLQKETQDWKASSEYLDVVNSVLAGSKEILDTKVLALSAEYTKVFSLVKSSGNEMSVERKFFREENGKRVEIAPGAAVNVGEKIIAEYILWSKENRSYVRLRSPREASLMPVEQRSGYRWGSGYRNVKADCTEFYFEAFPEEKTVLTEAFYVTQKGAFTAPVLELESLYATHYRANSQFAGVLKSD